MFQNHRTSRLFLFPSDELDDICEENFFTYGLKLSFLTENSIYDHDFQKNLEINRKR